MKPGGGIYLWVSDDNLCLPFLVFFFFFPNYFQPFFLPYVEFQAQVASTVTLVTEDAQYIPGNSMQSMVLVANPLQILPYYISLHECLVSQNKSESIILRVHWT